MDISINNKSESSIKKQDKNGKQNSDNPLKFEESHQEMRIELQNAIKKVSYACYLIVFILGIIISSIYILIKIQNALIVFDDIYQNWEQNFILDIYEKQDGLSCDEKDNQSNLFTYNFQGSKTGCFCEDCSDDGQVKVSGLMHGKDLNEEVGSGDYEYRNSRRRQRRRERRLQNRIRNAANKYSEYSDFEESDLEDIKSYKIIQKSCSDVDSIDDDDYFQKISFVNPKYISNLIGSEDVEIKLCINRSRKHNFFNTYYKVNTECESEEILCKGQNEIDKSYWFCIDKNEKCPVRSIHIIKSSDVSSSKYIYEEELKLSNGYSVLISRNEKDIMPISEIELLESEGPCISSTTKVRWRLSSDNIVFNPLLYEKQSFRCQPDTRFTTSGFQIDQKSLYNHSNILKDMIDANYPFFLLPQKRVKYNLFYRRYIYFAIECRFFLEDVQKLGEYINKLEKQSISIIATSSILCIFQMIDTIYIFMIIWQKKVQEPYPWKTKSYWLLIYSLLKYPIAISVGIQDFILFYRMITCREIGQDIINRNCTDEITSSQFRFMRNNLSFYGIFFHIILCFCFWSGDLHFLNLVRKYCLMNQKKMTPFDEFFSLPKGNKEYEKLNKSENQNNIGVQQFEKKIQNSQPLGENQNNDGLQQDEQQQIKSLNHIEQQQQQMEGMNAKNLYNIKLNGQIQSVSQQELGILPELMADISNKPPDLFKLEKKQSKPPTQDIQNNNEDDLIKLEITEEEEEFD